MPWGWFGLYRDPEPVVDQRLTHGPGKRKRKPRKKGRR